MFFYQNAGNCLFSQRADLPYPKASPDQAACSEKLIYLTEMPLGKSRASCVLNHPAMLWAGEESLAWLDRNYWDDNLCPLEGWLEQKIKDSQVQAVNLAWPGYAKLLESKPQGKKRVNLIALGDVGGTLMIGLRLLGGEAIHSVGMYDRNEALAQRWEYELNQIAQAWDYDSLPHFEIIGQEELFDCDMLVFCASAGVPPLDTSVQDVRLAQFQGNRKIISEYARAAREQAFQGILAVVSDPVELLCKAAFLASNQNRQGIMDWQGLRPEQIKGYGLGVMNSRGAYYSRKDRRFASFLREGRAFGPHGAGLVLANSLKEYDDRLSCELTKLAVEANLRTRETGFKPYIAPALSSGALSIIQTLKGEWHYSSNFLGGVYMGSKNRNTDKGLELELLPLPGKLLKRLEDSYADLAGIL